MSASTYVGVGAAVHGDNASLVPPLPGGIAAGDLLLVFASIRNTAAFVNSVSAPGGWTLLGNVNDHVRLYGQYWDGVFAAPTVAFAGGAAGDSTSAQMAAFRGTSVQLDGVLATLTNGSAANIAYPGFTPTRNGGVVIVGGWKQDDWTSVATLAGMTEIGEPSTLTGNDQGMVWDYVIQTTATAVTSGSFVVTGGVSAVSKGFVLSLRPQPSIATTTQDAYPPRVLVSVTDLAIADAVTVYRVVGGARTAVRAGSSTSVTDPSFLVVDAELPFGVPVSYLAVVNGVEYATGATTYTLTGSKVAISDAVTGLSAEVVILAAPERARDRRASTFQVGGRNVAVVGDTAGFSGTIELFLETTSSVENVVALLEGATEGVVQIRQAGTYDGVDCYVVVLGHRERRWSQDGSDDRRVLAMEVLEVERWAETLAAATYTYADLEALYSGLTYANLASAYATYLALAQADLT